jgi:hypothetical protein
MGGHPKVLARRPVGIMLEVFEETEAGSAGTQPAEGYSDVGTPKVS